MKIVFFEIQSWEKELLQKTFPEAIYTENALNNETVSEYKDFEIISTFIYSAVTKQVIDALPQLKYIVTRSTGYDHIDSHYAAEKGINVSNVPEYGSNTVAEHTFALILSLTRKIYQSVNQAKNLNFNHDQIRGVDILGKTLGVVGLGKIGQHVVRIAHGFGMKVLVYNRSRNPQLAKEFDFTYVDLNELLAQSDIVTLHLPLTVETKHTINVKNISSFKKHSYLINTARGGLIETEAIMTGLEKQILDGVGLDVLEDEKQLDEEVALLNISFRRHVDLKNLVYNHILINHPKVLITPHNAFNSQEALRRILDTTTTNIQSYLNGKLENKV